MDIYAKQRSAALCSILASGGLPMRMPIDLHLSLFESDAVFDIEIRYDYPGPRTILTVNGWRCDYFPSISIDRAQAKAAQL